MALQVGSNDFANIGRMFGQLNAPDAYGTRRADNSAAEADKPESLDRVSLSPLAPRPLSANFLEDALDAGRNLAEGGKIQPERLTRLREDRVFAAVSALAAIGLDNFQGLAKVAWPGGLPTPTGEEMEAARRRLAQRLDGVERARNPAAVQLERAELWRKSAKWNLAALAGAAADSA